MTTKTYVVAPLLWLFAASAMAQDSNRRFEYPATAKVDVVDVYHGVAVADPYRWLETPVKLGESTVDAETRQRSAQVVKWVDAQNRVTAAYLSTIAAREPIRKRLEALWNYERYSAPMKAGGRYYFRKNDGLQNQSVVYVQDTLTSPPRVFIDPNAFSNDGTVALTALELSENGRHAAYGVATAGSDWVEWRVRDITTGADLADVLRWTKSSSASWTSSGDGFFYSRYDEPAPGEQFLTTNLNQRLMFHRVGTAQSADQVVYRRPDEPEWSFDGRVTDDGRYLVITVAKSTDDRFRVMYVDLAAKGPWQPVELVRNFDHDWSFVGNEGTRFYFKTDLDAPRRRVVVLDIAVPDEPPKEIVPQTKDALVAVSMVGDKLFATYLEDAKTQVAVFELDGTAASSVKLPGIGTASGFGGRREHHETFYSFTSFTSPASTYRYDIDTGKSEPLQHVKSAFDGSAYEVEQVFYSSKDGTRVPMFLVHRRGIARDGNQPTLLTGYGGFNVPIVPQFSTMLAAWLEMGGVVASPNLRGGGEYGEEWHHAGTKQRKQNVFDDFIAAAEWLIAQRYTSASRLAIEGGSNGGLLVGAVMTQRPELFGACLPAVGVMDMLRYQKFTAGRFWVDDYGASDVAEEFPALLAYSPYHSLKVGTRYPATLVTTADTDDRVVPAHSFKFAARLQEVQAGDAPTLIRIETSAGHGAGTPVTKVIEQTADELAFLIEELRVDWPRAPADASDAS